MLECPVWLSAGEQLAGTTYSHPLCDRISSVLVGGDYITADSGTGLVHSAPGHGQEDYQVRRCRQLPSDCVSSTAASQTVKKAHKSTLLMAFILLFNKSHSLDFLKSQPSELNRYLLGYKPNTLPIKLRWLHLIIYTYF